MKRRRIELNSSARSGGSLSLWKQQLIEQVSQIKEEGRKQRLEY